MDIIESSNVSPAAKQSIPQALLTLLLAYISQEKYTPKTKNSFLDEYDYIVVGAGSAGSVVASRLSELPNLRILLLEAGDVAPPLSEVPSYLRFVIGTDADWKYKTVPQDASAFGHPEKKVVLNAGKALGGTSVINGMLSVRGNRENYDNWVKLGAAGWGYEDMLPYLIKLEDNVDINRLDQGYHGLGGPITVTLPRDNDEIKQPLIDSVAAEGYDVGGDYNGERQTRFTEYQSTIRRGRRCSAAKGYLVPADDRPNLDILKNAFATKILFDGLEAVGVQFHFDGQLRTVRARREVILSAGAFRTPQLLMLSGIGPCEHLAQFNIPCIRNSPVGQNLQDHIGTVVLYTIDRNITPADEKDVQESSILQFITQYAGPLTAPAHLSLFGFFSGVNTTSQTADFPRQEIYLHEDEAKTFEGILRPEVYNGILKDYEGVPLLKCQASLLQPQSRGYVALNSSDPFDPPVVNPRYYSDPSDLQDVLEGLRICEKIVESDQMKILQPKRITPLYPDCKPYIHDHDKLLECEARTLTVSYYHLVGTASMGDPHDSTSVVDPDLKVIGVNRLRVVDASVIPLVTSGNTQVPVMAVAEKIADKIKTDLILESEFFVLAL